ncbi:hypothetical protein [Anaerophilus nitritogenes]|uniref:hypothetical protein n=1 Tax=Anaerophilus nitritogenes TaxID=2498136 RepID=UPI00101D8CFF|nr:hypothetical protein [Anaerophilus nitritogenes]
MSRVKKNETEKTKKKQAGKRWLILPVMIILLISGILLVDDSYRSMMMIHEPKALGVSRLNENIYTFTFCGKNYYLNKEEAYEVYDYIKEAFLTFVESVKKQKEILLR